MSQASINPKVWFITGASTGFGRAVTELVLKNGDIAVATLRRPEALAHLSAKYSADRLLVLKLDVKNEDEITSAFAKTREVFGRLDVVYNNAAYGVASEVESAMGREDTIRDMFEVNFWGATHVSQAAVKFFREVNPPGVGGRLLQVSSMAGIDGMPAIGFYNATKFALEGLSEALARELDPAWNIKITIIEPAAFRTDAPANFSYVPALDAYKTTPAAAIRTWMQGVATNADSGDPQKAVQAFYKLANLPEPPLRLPLGKAAVEMVRKKGVTLVADADAYASWSGDLDVAA
ncbi:hypothetical protein CERSUDRAFT_98240 [Gelatoporia subvermispora B]|uniref:NAD-P-binding protein n=1 Tax=Ceriporiopsis subvermispora (strain B) TaxID=914234 RepID=M2Q9V8_CERS8|nr:hypothetical protein CERSUDRAFT_98240 [Gelatoporia subvermispora B]